jgi:hypothetical protein
LPSALLSGCQTPYGGGMIFSDYSAPIDVRDNATACTKSGKSTMVNILGMVSTGDAGVAAAKEKGGITKVGSVDVNFTNILGIVGKTTTVVCGE